MHSQPISTAVPYEEMAGQELRQRFRGAMRRLASGVGIVTTAEGERWFGMTATAITSLSMEPPALVVCVNKNASIHAPLHESGRFTVNLLRRDQAHIGNAFAKLPAAERFTVGEWQFDSGHSPYLIGAQAVIHCRLGPLMPFGTHTLLVGEVMEAIIHQEVAPLVFVDGNFLVE
ncbi:flavin reductase (DIM6/NTAB) family NADH-FMN oxidoreductase RutF [Rhodoligotrophos appendicifer]|uniref:flavin reductase family protein n=1 Tax=Rhodoligotrophos appendicifer TaxID=987056 RepID=UPI0011859D86|nr:flavin reductase family protein [Rhodoligotrophos appendicifer]